MFIKNLKMFLKRYKTPKVYSGFQSCKVPASNLKECSSLQNFAVELTEIENCDFSNRLQQKFFIGRLSGMKATMLKENGNQPSLRSKT